MDKTGKIQHLHLAKNNRISYALFKIIFQTIKNIGVVGERRFICVRGGDPDQNYWFWGKPIFIKLFISRRIPLITE